MAILPNFRGAGGRHGLPADALGHCGPVPDRRGRAGLPAGAPELDMEKIVRTAAEGVPPGAAYSRAVRRR